LVRLSSKARQSKVTKYLAELTADRRTAIETVRLVILKNIDTTVETVWNLDASAARSKTQ
jgi:hypothetical protein